MCEKSVSNTYLSECASALLVYTLKKLLPSSLFLKKGSTRAGFFVEVLLAPNSNQPDLFLVEETLRSVFQNPPSLSSIEITRENLIGLCEDQGEYFLMELLEEMPESLVEALRIEDSIIPCPFPHVDDISELKAIKVLGVEVEKLELDGAAYTSLRVEACCKANPQELKKHLKAWKKWKEAPHQYWARRLELYSSVSVGEGEQWIQQPRGAGTLERLRLLWENYSKNAHFIQSPLSFSSVSPFHLSAYLLGGEGEREKIWSSRECYKVEESSAALGTRTLAECIHIGSRELLLEQLKTSLQSIQEITTLFGIETRKTYFSPLVHRKKRGRGQEVDSAFLGFFHEVNEEVAFSQEKSEDFRLQVSYIDRLGGEWEGPSICWEWNPRKLLREGSLHLPKERFLQLDKVELLKTSLLGPFEHVLLLLLEQNEGKLPFWLMSEQVRILTAAQEQQAYARDLVEKLRTEGLGVYLDLSSRPLKQKVYEAQQACVPYTVVVGLEEERSKTLSVRAWGEKAQKQVALEEWTRQIVDEGYIPHLPV